MEQKHHLEMKKDSQLSQLNVVLLVIQVRCICFKWSLEMTSALWEVESSHILAGVMSTCPDAIRGCYAGVCVKSVCVLKEEQSATIPHHRLYIFVIKRHIRIRVTLHNDSGSSTMVAMTKRKHKTIQSCLVLFQIGNPISSSPNEMNK